MKTFKKLVVAAGCAVALLAAGANASVTIGGTRVVYPLGERETTVKLTNDSAKPSLVQVWLDDGNADAKPDEIRTPFVITPPIFRMEPQKSQMLRIMSAGEAMPTDRESIYWLNVLDVPPKAKKDPGMNSLQFAFRTRIKMFVRPAGLPGNAAEAPAKLSWKVVAAPGGKGQALSVSNPTPYYVSFSEYGVKSGGQTYTNDQGGMVPPKSTQVLVMPKMGAVSAGAKVHYSAINDYGGALVGEAVLGN